MFEHGCSSKNLSGYIKVSRKIVEFIQQISLEFTIVCRGKLFSDVDKKSHSVQKFSDLFKSLPTAHSTQK